MIDGHMCNRHMCDQKGACTVFWQFSNSHACPTIMHDQFSKHASPMITHDQSSEHASPMIAQGNQTTYQTIANAHNSCIAWGKQSYHDLAKI